MDTLIRCIKWNKPVILKGILPMLYIAWGHFTLQPPSLEVSLPRTYVLYVHTLVYRTHNIDGMFVEVNVFPPDQTVCVWCVANLEMNACRRGSLLHSAIKVN